MKLTLAAGLLTVAVAAVSAQPLGLLDARRQMIAAAAKGDKRIYDKFLSQDANWVSRDGRLRNRTAILEELQSARGLPVNSPTPEVRTYDDCAVLVGRGHDPDGVNVIYIEAWSPEGNQWRMVTHAAIAADSKNPGSPATKPSLPLPADIGLKSERDAVQKNIEAVLQANVKGDLAMFRDAVTSQFVNLQPDIGAVNKEQREEQIKSMGPIRLPSLPRRGFTATWLSRFSTALIINRPNCASSGQRLSL